MKNACYNPRVSQLSLISSNTVCVIPVRLSNLCGLYAIRAMITEIAV